MTEKNLNELETVIAAYLAQPHFKRTIIPELEKNTIVKYLPRKRRAGIYVLKYDNGKYYVGQSGNVGIRFGSHSRRRRIEGLIHITHVYYCPTARTKLDDEEAHIFHEIMSRIVHNKGDINLLTNKIRFIRAFEQHRNLYPSDFDITILKAPVVEKYSTIKQPPHSTGFNFRFFKAKILNKGAKPVDGSATKYDVFRESPELTKLFKLLKLYVTKGIPDAKSIEGKKWFCEFMPASPVAAEKIYARFYLNNQLVLLAFTWNDKARIVFNINKAGLPKVGKKVKIPAYKGLHVIDHSLKTPLEGPMSLNISDLEAAFSLMEDPGFLNAIRYSNTNLICTGKSNPLKPHESELAKLLLN